MTSSVMELASGEEKIVYMPSNLAAQLQLAPGTLLKVAAGAQRAGNVLRLNTQQEKQQLKIPITLLKYLGFEVGQLVNITWQNGTLRIGPLVGVLAPRQKSKTHPYSAQTSLFRRLIHAGNELGVCVFVFDFHHIDWSKKRVRGYTLAGDKWVARNYPIPDVVYDRTTGTFAGGVAAADAARRRLSQYQVPQFNTRLGSKMRLYQLMRADLLLQAHLPPTYRVSSTKQVAKVLAVSGSAYLKPQSGAQGKGIIRLRRRTGTWEYTLVNEHYQIYQGSSLRLADVIARLRTQVVLSGYLVQPDIRLIRWQGRICDVRALIQRDADGCWHLTGAAIRAGRPGGIISNLHGGGQALQLEQVLAQTLPGGAAAVPSVVAQIEQLSLRVGAVLAKGTKCLGELGVDLGVDKNGKVWVIEANSRTGRAVFRRAKMPQAAAEADRRPLRFALYLAGFTAATMRKGE